jgi:glycosyltransferase involved in cell wall biosynthesis
VEAFAEYLQKFQSTARLIIVGDLAQNKYCDLLLARIKELRIGDRIVVTGKVTTEQLKAFFLTAQMLLTTSRHEGFCLPLVEAMGLRTPIIAVRNGAIPDTAGEVAFYAEENPASVAEEMNRVVQDTHLREQRLRLGWQRYRQQFTNEAIAARFRMLVHRVIGSGSMPTPSSQWAESSSEMERTEIGV